MFIISQCCTLLAQVKAPSEHLLTYNTAMKASARPKAQPSESDRRHSGWSNKFKKDTIPPVDAVPLLPGQRPGGSPLRRRSDGGSRGDYQSEMNSSIDSHEEGQVDVVPGAYPGKSSYNFFIVFVLKNVLRIFVLTVS